jgi:hypothetical protein
MALLDDFGREFGEMTAEARPETKPAKGARQNGAIKFKLVSFDELKSASTTEYLVKGIFPRKGLAVVWGPPKSGKSLWVFTVMAHVALGREYRGRRVHQGEVAYLPLEGQQGFPKRRDAFRQEYLRPDEKIPAFRLCGASLDLIKDHKKLIADIKEQSAAPACVVIDTLNRSLRGSESKDEDMAAYLAAADAVQQAFDCLVVIIHHCGVNESRPRGHTSLTGAADVQISVKKDEQTKISTATVDLAKDMEEGAALAFRLEVVELGLDQDGDQITSCAVLPVEGDEVPKPTTSKARRESKSCQCFRAAFTEALDSAGQSLRIRHDGPAVRAANVANVFDQFKLRHATAEPDPKKRADAQRKAFERAMDKLSSEFPTWVNGETEWIWKTDKQP